MCITNILFIINESDSQISLLLHAPRLINKADPSTEFSTPAGRQAGNWRAQVCRVRTYRAEGQGAGPLNKATKQTKPHETRLQEWMGIHWREFLPPGYIKKNMKIKAGQNRGFPGGSMVKNLPANAGDLCLIPGLWRSPGEGNGNPLQ